MVIERLNHQLLLAFERVCQTVQPRPLLVLAGASPSTYGQQVVAQAAQLGLGDRVRTFFNLPPACLPSLYAACDVFVLPSAAENFGFAMFEAMASRRPVVCSDTLNYAAEVERCIHLRPGIEPCW